jgi:hypothetical protein
MVTLWISLLIHLFLSQSDKGIQENKEMHPEQLQ